MFGVLLALQIWETGNDPYRASPSGVDFPASGVFLLKPTVQYDGILYGFKAYYRAWSPFYLQIWRPVEGAENVFTLKWQSSFAPNRVNVTEKVSVQLQTLKVMASRQKYLWFAGLLLDTFVHPVYTEEATIQGTEGLCIYSGGDHLRNAGSGSFFSESYPVGIRTLPKKSSI